ncbi:MAG: 3-hydroxyacyl-ACP dehydratase FabZ family protein [Bacteroidota bacterium]
MKDFDQIAAQIIERLPYADPFLFVDRLIEISDSHFKGEYSFRDDAFFYRGHFKNKPVTPGVILLEAMGQTGLVCFGIYLLGLYKNSEEVTPMLSTLEADFYRAVLPGSKVIISAEKVYLRKNILKCKIEMTDTSGERIAVSTAICSFIKEKHE